VGWGVVEWYYVLNARWICEFEILLGAGATATLQSPSGRAMQVVLEVLRSESRIDDWFSLLLGSQVGRWWWWYI
jgi:hypothetical protein